MEDKLTYEEYMKLPRAERWAIFWDKKLFLGTFEGPTIFTYSLFDFYVDLVFSTKGKTKLMRTWKPGRLSVLPAEQKDITLPEESKVMDDREKARIKDQILEFILMNPVGHHTKKNVFVDLFTDSIYDRAQIDLCFREIIDHYEDIVETAKDGVFIKGNNLTRSFLDRGGFQQIQLEMEVTQQKLLEQAREEIEAKRTEHALNRKQSRWFTVLAVAAIFGALYSLFDIYWRVTTDQGPDPEVIEQLEERIEVLESEIEAISAQASANQIEIDSTQNPQK